MTDEVTPLPPGQERAFQVWLRQNHVRDLDHPDSHYDYRGAFLAGVGRGGGAGHFPDTFKQHGHPTFSVESRYSKGPGDGGSWDGENFMPAPVEAPQQKFLPGQNAIPYAQQHGLPSTPYGMENGPVALPGINDRPGQRFGGAAPEPIVLDEEPAAPQGQPSGWRVKNDRGEVVATMPTNPKSGQDYQRFQVQSIANSLISQAVTPAEREAAMRAAAYGASLVGTMDVSNIQKEIVHRYDTDTGYSEKRELQGMRTRNRGGGAGVPGIAGPTKADKWEKGLDDGLRKTISDVVESERKDSKHAKIAELDNDLSEMEALMSSGNAMGQRVAVQKALLALTGKASRESEQSALTAAAGKFTEWANKIGLYTDSNPTLDPNYIKQFRGMVAEQKAYVRKQREAIGKAAGVRAAGMAIGYPDDQRQLAYDLTYGAMTGQYGGRAAFKPQAPAAAAPPSGAPAAGGGFDPDL
jgi:hypothetical protein